MENAEKRMKRLTNQCENENDDGENKKDTEKSDNTNTNAINVKEDHKTEVTGLVKQEQSNTEAKTELRQRGTVKIQRNIESARPERLTNDAATHIKTTEKSETDLNLTLKQIEGLKISSLMLLAVICRLILNCGFGLFYFQSIFLPFVAIEVGWTHYQLKNSLEVPRQRNKMSTVLLLCGLKQDMLHIYDRIMGYVTTFSEDFGLFVFSFFISNILIS